MREVSLIYTEKQKSNTKNIYFIRMNFYSTRTNFYNQEVNKNSKINNWDSEKMYVVYFAQQKF